MTELSDSLVRLRDAARIHGMPWGEPVPSGDVRAILRRFGAPEFDELVTWYSLCPAGTSPSPLVLVQDLEETAEAQEDMRVTALRDFPDDASDVVDWYPLSSIEAGALVIWVPPGDGARPLIWRSEIYEIEESTRFTLGLPELIEGWIKAWRDGRFVVRPRFSTPSFRDEPATLTLM